MARGVRIQGTRARLRQHGSVVGVVGGDRPARPLRLLPAELERDALGRLDHRDRRSDPAPALADNGRRARYDPGLVARGGPTLPFLPRPCFAPSLVPPPASPPLPTACR